jgi:phosphotransferase system enzyme I (PtsI)
MQSVRGLGVSPGIVIGRVLVIDDELRKPTARVISPELVVREVERLEQAVGRAIEDIKAVYAEAQRQMGKETAAIFLFHIGMLSDKSLLTQVKARIEKDLVCADYALTHTLSDLAEQFRRTGNSVFATKVNDIEDLAARLLRHLQGKAGGQRQIDEGTIILARDLTPSQTVGFDRSKVIGFVTDLGGMTSHTAIIAKALEIPAVVGCKTLLRSARDGQTIVLDGERGVVVLDPDEATLAEYRRLIEQQRLFHVSLDELSALPSVTVDGTTIKLVGNIELPDEIQRVLRAGGTGVGLYRTEYLYLTSNQEPTEEEHFAAYKRCVELAAGRDLVIRTMDLGADKYTQAQEEIPERNPFLGNRSIRYCLRNLPMFKRQLRALLRASALGPIKVMFPLITSIGELRQAKFIVRDVMEEMDEEGLPFDRSIALGMMVEVPSAAIQAETFAREADFFSIGTNDLVQYTLAVDRTNERVANLYTPMHPAVIRLIRDVARAGKKREIEVSCCGEAAGDLEFAMLLIGLGLRTLSTSSSSIPQLKRFVRSVSVQQCERAARQALALDSEVQVAAMLHDRARKLVPEAFSGRSAE